MPGQVPSSSNANAAQMNPQPAQVAPGQTGQLNGRLVTVKSSQSIYAEMAFNGSKYSALTETRKVFVDKVIQENKEIERLLDNNPVGDAPNRVQHVMNELNRISSLNFFELVLPDSADTISLAEETSAAGLEVRLAVAKEKPSQQERNAILSELDEDLGYDKLSADMLAQQNAEAERFHDQTELQMSRWLEPYRQLLLGAEAVPSDDTQQVHDEDEVAVESGQPDTVADPEEITHEFVLTSLRNELIDVDREAASEAAENASNQ